MLLYFVMMAGGVWLALHGAQELGYQWQWRRALRFVVDVRGGWQTGPLVQGMLMTLLVSGLSLLLAFVAGVSVALLGLSHSS